MRRAKQDNLLEFLKDYKITARAADYFKDVLDFQVDLKLPQRKLVDLGRVLGRIISMELVIDLGDRGFRNDLITHALTVLRQDIESLLQTYRTANAAVAVEAYEEESFWLNFVR
jgi:hypothetical protein